MDMKFWNKDKTIREKYWHKVEIPRKRRTVYDLLNKPNAWDDIDTFDDLKLWCQHQPSVGKFYGTIYESLLIRIVTAEAIQAGNLKIERKRCRCSHCWY
jgi:hypothetical protein